MCHFIARMARFIPHSWSDNSNVAQQVPHATPLPRAEVTFTVRLPEPLPANEILVVSVLDEVTGLALNPVDYQMTMVDAITYTAKLAIPDRALLKYRYVTTRRGACQRRYKF